MAAKKTAKTTRTRKVTRKPAKKAQAKAASTESEAKPKALIAIDAAAKVLGEAKEPMSAKEMIQAMAAKKYWSSPAGKTPHATLYSAIAREINKRGKESRFKKAGRGKFGLNR